MAHYHVLRSLLNAETDTPKRRRLATRSVEASLERIEILLLKTMQRLACFGQGGLRFRCTALAFAAFTILSSNRRRIASRSVGYRRRRVRGASPALRRIVRADLPRRVLAPRRRAVLIDTICIQEILPPEK